MEIEEIFVIAALGISTLVTKFIVVMRYQLLVNEDGRQSGLSCNFCSLLHTLYYYSSASSHLETQHQEQKSPVVSHCVTVALEMIPLLEKWGLVGNTVMTEWLFKGPACDLSQSQFQQMLRSVA